MRWIRRILVTLIAVVLVGAAAGYAWLRTSLPTVDGEIALDGLDAPVRILRDRHGIPRIRAETESDAYFALGFVHAQDRLFQMDFMRRFGAGRLSEVVGDATLHLDRATRTLGLYRLAEAGLAHLGPGARAAIDSYTAGVNAFLDSRDGAPPPEFLALRYRPERWRPADSLVWGRIMGLRLSGNWHEEALRAALAKKISPDRLADLWPPSDGKVRPTVSAAAGTEAATSFAALLRDFPAGLGHLSASNSWVVAGRHTTTGKPILANDPHLGYRAPILWYLARIEFPGFSVTGATVPGVPFTILGHNGHVAWGLTTTHSDTQDLFVERLDPASPDRYLAPDGPRAFVRRQETIRVRGRDPIRIAIRETRHGPVLSDVRRDLSATSGDGHVVALAATSLIADDRTAEALYLINRARDWRSFLAATRLFHAPHQNLSYADTAGNIGFIAAARVPIRKSGDGTVPAPGWTGSHDWTGFIPFDELPRVLNPPSGRIVNANHRVAPDSYRHFLGQTAIPAYRAARIHQMLDEATPHGPSRSAAMQLDETSLMFRALGPLLLKAPAADAAARRAVAMLGRWDGDMARDRPEPLIFVAWVRRLTALVARDELGDLFAAYRGLRPGFLRRVLTSRNLWCDDIRTPGRETCEALVSRALSEAMAELAESYGGDPDRWRWGRAHLARFGHPVFGYVPVLKALFDLSAETGGGSYTLNRGGIAADDSAARYANRHGAGLRAVYDLSRLDDSQFVLATGQSGNRLSPLYDNLLPFWRDGRYLRIAANLEGAPQGARGLLALTPRRLRAGGEQ